MQNLLPFVPISRASPIEPGKLAPPLPTYPSAMAAVAKVNPPGVKAPRAVPEEIAGRRVVCSRSDFTAPTGQAGQLLVVKLSDCMGKSDRKSLSAAASRDHRQLQLRTLRITIATHTGFCIYFCAFSPFLPVSVHLVHVSTFAFSSSHAWGGFVVTLPRFMNRDYFGVKEWKGVGWRGGERGGKGSLAKLLINSTLMQRKGNLRFYAARCSALFLSYTSFNEGNYGKTDKLHLLCRYFRPKMYEFMYGRGQRCFLFFFSWWFLGFFFFFFGSLVLIWDCCHFCRKKNSWTRIFLHRVKSDYVLKFLR